MRVEGPSAQWREFVEQALADGFQVGGLRRGLIAQGLDYNAGVEKAGFGDYHSDTMRELERV